MAEAVLSAFLQVAFDKMASPEVLDFIKGRKFNGELLKKLKITLRSINVVLNDAEQKQFTDDAVKEWLIDLKDAVYHAEDVLDEIATEASICKLDTEFETDTTKVWKFISTSLNPFHKGMEQKVQQILGRLEDLEKQKYVLALKDDVKHKLGRNLPQTTSLLEEFVCGRDNDRDNIVNLLLSNDASSNKMSVITIWGLGGLGKTTLAQLIFNDSRVEESFKLKAWVCVSEDFDVSKVTKTVLHAVTSKTPETETDDLNQLQVKLKAELEGKKFLVVLDDVWNDNYDLWDVLKKPFNFGAQGSKIIVTTRNESVASVMRTVPTYPLKQLSDEDCWLIFAKHAFINGDSGAWPTHLEVMGREIVKKCKGLPLAAKTLGGLLRTEQDPDEWDKVLKSEIRDLPDDRSNILPVLQLSFNRLPSHLKRCFAYCSIFPKDYEFRREELILLWMAEDFLNHPKRNKTMEEVGDEYFNDLISRSFFQRSHDDESCFIMHDLVNDLAKYVSGEFCFRLEVDHSSEITKKTRHLSYFRARDDSFEKFKALYEVKCLRTFMHLERYSSIAHFPWFEFSIDTKVPNDLLLTLNCLRVLYLSHYGNIIELPDSIGNLKHLRYLDLSDTRIIRLPDSICDLYNLQTLKLSNCDWLTELPINIERLINLRHLYIEGTNLKEMPLQIVRLKNLQTLNVFFLGQHGGSRIKELKEFQHLRGSLQILKLQNDIQATDASEANIKGKKYIEELKLDWDSGRQINDSQNERDVLDKLQPHKNLKKLSIQYFCGTRFPNWVGDHSFANIVSIQLSNCKHCWLLPPLGQLPSLKDLCIKGFDGVVSVGPEFCGNGSSVITPFGSLEILKFNAMLEWQEWFSSEGEDEGGAFPQLRELHITSCPKLTKGLPNHLPQLTKLVINYCDELVAILPRAPISSNRNLTIGEYDAKLEFPNLRRLEIRDCEKLKLLPERMHDLFPSLQYLDISWCLKVESFPEGGLPRSLRVLDIDICDKLIANRMGWGLQRLPCLREFSIRGSSEEVESFPEEGLMPCTLTHLFIEGFPNMKVLDGKGLQHLTSLVELRIENLWKLQSIPEEGLPTSLSVLRAHHCPLLKQRCQRDRGEDWPKIANIPYIDIY